MIWRVDSVESRSTITACCQLGRGGKFWFGFDLVWGFLFLLCVDVCVVGESGEERGGRVLAFIS